MVIAVILAKPLVGKSEQAFQFIQEFTGFFTPGIVVIFLFGFFWKKATANSALTAAIASVVFSWLLKIYFPEVPFMDRVSIVFVICVVLAVLVTYIGGAKDQAKAIEISDISFKTTAGFNVAALGVLLVLTAIYTLWW
jgi:SSS family solute:Na+ symporter